MFISNRPPVPLRVLSAFAITLVAFCMNAFAGNPTPNLMPMPASVTTGVGRLPVGSSLSVAISKHVDARLEAGISRALTRLEQRTGLTLGRRSNGSYDFTEDAEGADIVIAVDGPGWAVPTLGEDESYRIDVTDSQCVLKAPTVVGALRGLETLLQLLQSDSSGWALPAVSIQDQPRFPWRGLMIDVARHWQPMEVIKRNLDGMALVKLNVLHIHLTEDQGFRIESKTHPELHEQGSDGHYFTQDEMREIIAYATARGIRVVPEFDMPGHATSWVVSHPELASAPGPYTIQRHWGVFDPVLDPTNPRVYELMDAFIGEMASLFPDAYLHIGGDENNGVQWNANKRIQAYIAEHDLKDNAGLHADFNTRIHAILKAHRKQLVGWDEILHPDLSTDCVVHSWRGPEGIAEATKRGYSCILSNGYYIDLCYPTWQHYQNDPVPVGTTLSPEQQKRVLGGEATMWAEWATPETIDSRIWPRTAAIAERLWSPQDTRDLSDMYRRLAIVSRRLEEAGLRHESYLDPSLRRLAGESVSADELSALRTLVDLAEPVKGYRRGELQPDADQFTPLTGFVDCSRPDSTSARVFSEKVEEAVLSKDPAELKSSSLLLQLTAWKLAAGKLLSGLVADNPRLQEVRPLVYALIDACDVGQEAAQLLSSGKPAPSGWLEAALRRLDKAAIPQAATELPIIIPLRELAIAAASQDQRAKLSDDEWRKFLVSQADPASAAAH